MHVEVEGVHVLEGGSWGSLGHGEVSLLSVMSVVSVVSVMSMMSMMSVLTVEVHEGSEEVLVGHVESLLSPLTSVVRSVVLSGVDGGVSERSSGVLAHRLHGVHSVVSHLISV